MQQTITLLSFPHLKLKTPLIKYNELVMSIAKKTKTKTKTKKQTKKQNAQCENCELFHMGQNEDCGPGDSISDRSEKLLQGVEGQC